MECLFKPIKNYVEKLNSDTEYITFVFVTGSCAKKLCLICSFVFIKIKDIWFSIKVK